MGRMIGIDLGTTNSVAAIMDGPQPRVLDNREAKSQTRSVVSVKRRRGRADAAPELLVGDAAFDNWPLAPKDTIVSVKRLMGRALSDREVQRVKQWALYNVVEPADGTRDSVRVLLDGAQRSPIEISALILKKVKEDAEFRLGEPVSHAVITVPAYFSQIQRDATRKAGLKAGLTVIKILDEPTAAAIAFGVQSEDGAPRTLLVYDLGGGTFDISVLMCAGNVFAPLNLEGDMWLGGDNFDDAIVEHAVAHVQREHGLDPRSNVRFMAELKRSAQAVKERLSSAESADLLVTGILQDASGNLIDVELEVSRRQFERMLLPLISGYRACGSGHANSPEETSCAECREPLAGRPIAEGRALALVKKALAHASVNLSPGQIDYVLMAGNSTNLPLVQRSMEQLFGAEKVVRKVHPKHAVALGAAMVAAWMGKQCVCQAADPADPSRECGHVNEDSARACAKCGASLVLEENAAPTSSNPNAAAGTVGGIAPFNYGTQTAGDAFSIFIRKGDPFPSQELQAQIFRTRVPRQRMVSIPIYGGDDIERASANEKQGEAFAVLPPDLPQGAAVRVRLWLDRDGIFGLTAHLDDGTDLRPWVVKGEADARAIDAVQRFDKATANAQLDSNGQQQLAAARGRVFEKLRQHDFEGAFRDAEEANARIQKQGEPTPASREADARSLLRWAEFVSDRYGWAFEATVVYRIAGLLQDLRTALSTRDPGKLDAAQAALDSATAVLPEPIETLLRIRHAISSRIRPADPARAAALLARIEEVEMSLRQHSSGALAEVEKLVQEVSQAIQAAARSAGLRCSNGHSVPVGERRCPECGEDTWSLDAGAGGLASGRLG